MEYHHHSTICSLKGKKMVMLSLAATILAEEAKEKFGELLLLAS
jgi:hypothetical protein